jgi:hypothetical protein
MTIFYCLRFETPPTWRARSPFLYSSGAGWPGYTARYWVPFSSPPTTRRATVDVFNPTSTRDTDWLNSKSKAESKLLYDWQFTANQFVLASSSLRLTTTDLFFLKVSPCGNCPYVTFSLRRRWVSLMNVLGLSSSIRFALMIQFSFS